jgi:hypothetical protein
VIARRLTVVLPCICFAVPVLMYVRDAGASPPPPTPGQARVDAGRLLAALSPRCTSTCHADVLRMSAPHTWRVQLSVGTWQRCYDLDASAFGFSSARGFSGLTTAPCRNQRSRGAY